MAIHGGMDMTKLIAPTKDEFKLEFLNEMYRHTNDLQLFIKTKSFENNDHESGSYSQIVEGFLPCDSLKEALDILSERIKKYSDKNYIENYGRVESSSLLGLGSETLVFDEDEDENWQAEQHLAFTQKIYCSEINSNTPFATVNLLNEDMKTLSEFLYENLKEFYMEEIQRLNNLDKLDFSDLDIFNEEHIDIFDSYDKHLNFLSDEELLKLVSA